MNVILKTPQGTFPSTGINADVLLALVKIHKFNRYSGGRGETKCMMDSTHNNKSLTVEYDDVYECRIAETMIQDEFDVFHQRECF